MKTEKSIQFLSNNRKLIAGPCKKQFFLSFYLFYYIHTPVPPLSQANQSDGNSVAREVEFDHHLTTSSSQPVPCIVFYVPTFFYNHHKQRRKLCILHNFRRFIMLFSRTSQFSDPEGRWFESSRAHQGRRKLVNRLRRPFCEKPRTRLFRRGLPLPVRGRRAGSRVLFRSKKLSRPAGLFSCVIAVRAVPRAGRDVVIKGFVC